jgi:hypothetical protein
LLTPTAHFRQEPRRFFFKFLDPGAEIAAFKQPIEVFAAGHDALAPRQLVQLRQERPASREAGKNSFSSVYGRFESAGERLYGEGCRGPVRP